MSFVVLDDRFCLIYCIGSGSFGEVYVAEDLKNKKIVALKVEFQQSKCQQLQYESKIYEIMSGCVNIANISWYGSYKNKNIMAFDRLSQSIDKLFNYRMRNFSLKTVLMLADQMISAIQFFHSKGFVHRDIKAENFMMGAGKNKSVLYLIDFGLAGKYRNIDDVNDHYPLTKNHEFMGTAKFQSINAHKGYSLSRRDDMEAIGYLLVYLMKGTLPWMEIKSRATSRDPKLFSEEIKNIKMKTSTEVLCNKLPHEFYVYLNDVKNLKYEEEPKYASYRKMFRELFMKSGFIYDGIYDWTGFDYAKSAAHDKVKEYKQQTIRKPIYLPKKQKDNSSKISKQKNLNNNSKNNANYNRFNDRMSSKRRMRESLYPTGIGCGKSTPLSYYKSRQTK